MRPKGSSIGFTLRFPPFGRRAALASRDTDDADPERGPACSGALHGFDPVAADHPVGPDARLPYFEVAPAAEGGLRAERERAVLTGGQGGAVSLSELVYAMMMARASYGPLCHAGYLSSVQTLTSPSNYADMRALLSATPSDYVRSVSALSGLPVEDIVMCFSQGSAYRPAHYVGVDRARRAIVVAVRGSMQLGDVLTDLACSAMDTVLWCVAPSRRKQLSQYLVAWLLSRLGTFLPSRSSPVHSWLDPLLAPRSFARPLLTRPSPRSSPVLSCCSLLPSPSVLPSVG